MIDDGGSQIGITTTEEALKLAREKDMDLVEISPDAKPPVCKIMNYGKYLYQKSKRAHEAKKHQKQIQVKEVKFRVKIDEHDYQFKKNHITRFLLDGNKVKATIMFRGRERSHGELGDRILDRLRSELEELATVEARTRLEGNQMYQVMAPKRAVIQKLRAGQAAQAEPTQ
ncbi:MAG: translation initiation factor IF-3 [Acidobacteriota bacterium]